MAVYLPRDESIGGALLLHGFSGTKEGLALLATSLAEAGYVVFTPDWRGHGGSGGTLSGQNAAIKGDAAVFAEVLRSTYNLSFTVIGGHSMGGAFAQLVASELNPRCLVIISSRAVPGVLASSLANGTKALFMAASLDEVVNPDSVKESLSQVANSSVEYDTLYNIGEGAFTVTLIEGLDHLTVLYAERLPRESLSFLNVPVNVPYAQVLTLPFLAAVLWVLGLVSVASVGLPSSSQAPASFPPGKRSRLWLSSPYLIAGVFQPFLSFAGFLVPGLGTSSFFLMVFLSIVISITTMMKLRVVRVKVNRPPYSHAALAWGIFLGLGFVLGLHLILGRNVIRFIPSVYSLPTAILTFPVAAIFVILDVSILDSLSSLIPRWMVGVGTKALSLASSLLILLVLSPQQGGLSLISAYMILLLLTPIYAIESRLTRQGRTGRFAFSVMFTVAISLLAAASGARLT